MPSRGQKWTSEQVETLKALHAKGMSCALMASELACGFTRNAIIGKLHRMGLSNATSTIRKVGGNKRLKKVPPKTSRVVWANGNSDKLRLIDYPMIESGPVRCVQIETRGISLLDLLDGECRYPDGEGARITFCGHPKLDDSSYCGPHFALSTARARTNSDSVTAARSRRMRGINFRRLLLEAVT